MTNKKKARYIAKKLQQTIKLLETKKKITLKEFWESKQELAIRCDTEEKAKTLLSAFDKMGKKWSSGGAYSTCTYWQNHRSKTVYYNDNTYGYFEYAIGKNTKVYKFEDVDLTIPKEYHQFTEDEKPEMKIAFDKLAEETKEFLQKYYNPHTKIVADISGIEVVQGVLAKSFELND